MTPDKSHQSSKKEASLAKFASRIEPLQQKYSNGCGAACLLSIAYALGVKNIPVLPGSRSDDAEDYTLAQFLEYHLMSYEDTGISIVFSK